MRRKGVSEDMIDREKVALDGAVRASIWDAVLAPRKGC
ncbi:hypothetical protein ACVWY5_005669 [Bradyrhizobium sp. USDA 3256]